MEIDIHKCTLFQVLITFDSDNDKFPKRYCVVLELTFEGCRNSFMVVKYMECRLITSSVCDRDNNACKPNTTSQSNWKNTF